MFKVFGKDVLHDKGALARNSIFGSRNERLAHNLHNDNTVEEYRIIYVSLISVLCSNIGAVESLGD